MIKNHNRITETRPAAQAVCIIGAALLILLGNPAVSYSEPDAWEEIQRTGQLRWGADDAGGAPYVFPDPENPGKLIGFEIEIMDAVADILGVEAKLVVVPWDQLVPALLRNDFDVAVNGLEITPERREAVDFSVPYYFFAEQITSRRDGVHYRSLDELKGKRVGTLSASLAQTLMEARGGIDVVAYPSPVEAYKDLEIGRVDAALLDVPIASYYAGPNPALVNTGDPVGEGIYAAAVRKDSVELKRRLDEAFTQLIRSGELEAIYRRWGMWTELQHKLSLAPAAENAPGHQRRPLHKFIPTLLKGAAVTVMISCLSMILAVIGGLLLCLAKLYGGRLLKGLSTVYIELVRGTPLLIQLYLIYYGLPNLGIELNAFVAAVLGMGMNYAAYEAEIYRAGLLSIPKGQDEAARSLGMSGRQSLRYILLPQAFRTILPPSTNDFIALFKDTSLVSIITVTELTRAYSQAATTTYRFMEIGLLTALLYFLMSFPLSLWSRHMEKHRHVMHSS